ncbi:MAG: DUF302 domain-containing protein [Candidatus Marithrix sp.]
MRKWLVVAFFLIPLTGYSTDGMISIQSTNGSVAEVANRLESILSKKGLKIFNRISHSDGAKTVDLKLAPTELLIFGNPKVGTPLMQCNQTTGIDLPQKMLIWQDDKDQVWLTYNDPQYIAERHGISDNCAKVITKIGKVLNKLANAASKPLPQ